MSTALFDIVSGWIVARIQRPNGIARGVLAGAGAAYCIAEKKPLHLPIALLAPGLYCGAAVYMEWDELVKESKVVVQGTKIMAQREKEIITAQEEKRP